MENFDWVLFMGSYPPRECGIATFTRDLSSAMQKKFSPLIKPKILALNDDNVNIYNYSSEVRYKLDETDIQQYIEIAKDINKSSSIKLINIQHEFGLYGGEYGNYLLPFLETIEKPVVTTLHTVLPDPEDKRLRTVKTIADKSEFLVVMTNMAKNILMEEYCINRDKIVIIPHGIPYCEFMPSSEEKSKIGYKNRIILSSFGMMNQGKGYEQVLDALPRVVEEYPNLLYLIIGETHPIVRKKEGEKYRKSLEKKVMKLGLSNNVKFYNKYVKLSEIIKYLLATDIYISSSLDPNQIVSGTLSYAMGCGRPVISTPFSHAKEVVTDDRGLLVEYGNPDSYADAILKLLSDPQRMQKMGHNAYAYTRNMTWPNIALSYMKVFSKYVKLSHRYGVLPEVKLDHLKKLTDEFGIIQFAKNTKPDTTSGYSLDDVARALIVCTMYLKNRDDASLVDLVRIYLDYMSYVQRDDGLFLNFVDQERKVDLENISEDTHGRAMWALGYVISEGTIPTDLKKLVKSMFVKGIDQSMKMRSPRATAFNINGFYFFNKANPSDENIQLIRGLADHLVSIYGDNFTKEWKWFEDYITYANSKISESLLYAYQATEDKKYLEVAESSLEFLISMTFREDMFSPIGHDGWYKRNGRRAHYDQQPIEAGSMVQTLALAHEITQKKSYKKRGYQAFHWFLGHNHLNQVIYNEKTGGCHDGLGRHSINLNQGAESTLLYLLARLSLE